MRGAPLYRRASLGSVDDGSEQPRIRRSKPSKRQGRLQQELQDSSSIPTPMETARQSTVRYAVAKARVKLTPTFWNSFVEAFRLLK